MIGLWDRSGLFFCYAELGFWLPVPKQYVNDLGFDLLTLLLALKLLASQSMHQTIALVCQLVARGRLAEIVRGVDIMLETSEETTVAGCLRAWTVRPLGCSARSIRLSLWLQTRLALCFVGADARRLSRGTVEWQLVIRY